MTTTLLTLAFALTGADTPRPPSFYAPSLPALTREEEDRLDGVIDRFILYDTGRLRGEEARKALRDFQQLGPEAIPALIRGLNRAAEIEHSCPVVVIAKKLQRMLLASDDPQLLEFARDEIGADVGRTRHAGVLRDLRLACMLRKNALAQRPPRSATPRPPQAMTTAELAEAAGNVRGPRLRPVLFELARRAGKDALAGLSVAAGSYETETRQLGRDLLDQHLARQTAAYVKEKLADEQAEVRKAAARVVSARFPGLGGDLIALLNDEDPGVRAEAHRALVRLSRGQDLGPTVEATRAEREQAQERWRSWWSRSAR